MKKNFRFVVCLLIGFSGSVALAAEDYESRIEALEAQLAELKAEMAASKQVADGAAALESDADSEEPEAGTPEALFPMQRESVDKYLTGEDLLDDAFPNSLPIPGSEARFRIGGYAKLDFVQDLDYVGDRFEFELATIPVEGTPESELDGRTTLHAKETRINFDIRSTARNEELGWEFPLQAYLELDFFDDRETFSLQPRLRQAYGVVGRILAGQTWAITTDLAALAGTIDFSGGDSLYGARLAQVRWQDKIGDSWTWLVGIEDPKISVSNPFGLEGEDRTSLPNFAGSLRWTGEKGQHLSFGLDLFQVEWQGGATGPDDKELGFAAVVSGRTPIGDSGKHAISGAITTGSGAAHRVISLGFDGGNDAVITPAGLDVMRHWQVYGGYSHYWRPNLNSTLALAWAELDNSAFQDADAIHSAGSVHLNLIWFPYELVSTGVEYMWGYRENNDGADGTASRIQFMVKYQFN